MKIKIKHTGNNNFYDKFVFISYNIGNIEKGKCKKIQKMTSQSKKNVIISFASALIFAILYLVMRSMLYFAFACIFTLALAFFLAIHKNIKNLISLYSSDERDSEIVIDNDGVELIKDTQNVKLKWESVLLIVDSDDIICFIPKTRTELLLGVDSAYKKEIMNGLDKYKKSDLIVKM